MAYLDIMLGALQWIILLIFIVVGFFVGKKRGFKKSYYYLITNFVITLSILIIVSLVSIRLIFPTAGDLLAFVSKYLSLNDNILNYIKNPKISPVFFALVDVLFKIVVFIILFPLAKILLNLLLFKPLYRLIFTRKKDNRNLHVLYNSTDKISSVSKFTGGVIGIIRGFFASFIILIPIILIAGIFTNQDFEEQTPYSTEVVTPLVLLETTNNTDKSLAEFIQIFDLVEGINNYGPGRFVKKIKINNRSIDEEIFDTVFGGVIETKDEDGTINKEKLKISQELNLYGTIFKTLIKDGYLNETFDFKTINYEDDYENIEYVLNSLGHSQLLNLAMPILIDVLDDEEIFLNKLGFSIKDINDSDLTYKNLQSINWNKDLKTISKVVESLLKTGSVSELEELIKNPKEINQLEQNLKDNLVDMLEQLSNLEALIAGNVLVEYLLRDEKVVNIVTWEEEPFEYARDKAQFIFKKRNFFQNELKVVHNLAKEILSEDFSEYNFNELIKDNEINIDYLLNDASRELFITSLENIIHFETFKNGLPVAIDASLYYTKINIGEQSKNKIGEIIDNINYQEEINNVDNIYKNIVNLGVNDLLKNNKELIAEVDKVLVKPDSFEAVKEIVNIVLIESEFVGELLEYGSEKIINKFVPEGTLKTVLLEIDSKDDFNYGLEVVNSLNLAEDIYKVSNLKTFLSHIENKEYIELSASLSVLNNQEQYNFRMNLLNFQTINYLDYETLVNIKNSNEILDNNIIVPLTVTTKSIKQDINLLLDLAFEFAHEAKENNLKTKNIKETNLENAFNKEKLAKIFKFQKDKDEDSIFLHSAINLIQNKGLKLGNYGTIEAAPVYKTYKSNSEEWINEINTLITGTLDLLDGLVKSDNFTLTYNNLLKMQDINNLDLKIFNDLESAGSFNKLGQSYNARYNITNFMTSDDINNKLSEILSSMLNKDINKVNLKLETDWLDADGFFSNKQTKALLKSLVALDIEKINNLEKELGDKIFGLAKNNKLEQFYESDYIRTMASRFLLSETIKETLANSANLDYQKLNFNITDKDHNNNLTKDEVINIFKAFDLLKIDNPSNININNSTLKGLTEDELEQVLVSNYFYHIIDLTLKEQIDVPQSSLVNDNTKYNGMIKKTEIKSLIDALIILDVEDEINLTGVRLSQVKALISLNSNIIDKLISDEVKQIVDVPISSQNSNNSNIIFNNELNNLILAIEVISDETDPLLNSINMSAELELTIFDNLLAIGDSPIINRLISESIIESFAEEILRDLLENDSKDVKRLEINRLNITLHDLEFEKINKNLDVNEIKIEDLIEATNNIDMSIIIQRIISNSTKETLNEQDIIFSLETNSNYISREELNKLFRGINVLAINNLNEVNQDDYFLNINFDLIINANNIGSNIIRKIISNILIEDHIIITDRALESYEFDPNIEIIKENHLREFLVASSMLNEDVKTIGELIDYLNSGLTRDVLISLLDFTKDEDHKSIILEDTIENLIIKLIEEF